MLYVLLACVLRLCVLACVLRLCVLVYVSIVPMSHIIMPVIRVCGCVCAGAEPRCLLDFWAIRVNELIAEAAADRTTPEEFTSDWAMGDSMMDFLFASQDASTASLVWSIHFMSEHPEMLARVREEQAAVNPDNGPLTYELLEKMTFARCIVKEILRIRTPPPMVPHIAMDDIKLTEKVTLSFCIPSTTSKTSVSLCTF